MRISSLVSEVTADMYFLSMRAGPTRSKSAVTSISSGVLCERNNKPTNCVSIETSAHVFPRAAQIAMLRDPLKKSKNAQSQIGQLARSLKTTGLLWAEVLMGERYR